MTVGKYTTNVPWEFFYGIFALSDRQRKAAVSWDPGSRYGQYFMRVTTSCQDLRQSGTKQVVGVFGLVNSSHVVYKCRPCCFRFK